MADKYKFSLKSSTSLISLNYPLFKAIVLAAPFLVNQASAQTCTAVPSCASLGYSRTTSSSCTNKILCPFDSSYSICLDCNATPTTPSTCADFGYTAKKDLDALKKQRCAHPTSKYCTCTEATEASITDLGLLCYTSCSEPNMTCKDFKNGQGQSYGTREEQVYKACEFDDEFCHCQLADEAEIVMRGLECYSPCTEAAFSCKALNPKWRTEREARIDDCGDDGLGYSSFCKCTPVERTPTMAARDEDCYASESACEYTAPACSDINSAWRDDYPQGYVCEKMDFSSGPNGTVKNLTDWERNELGYNYLTCYRDCVPSTEFTPSQSDDRELEGWSSDQTSDSDGDQSFGYEYSDDRDDRDDWG